MSSPIIDVRDVVLRRDGRVILEDVNFTVDRGDFIAVTGPNGGGKTTLLRLMLKLISPTAGEVVYIGSDGQPVPRLNIGYLPQKNLIDSKFPITVEEVVATGLLNVKGLGRGEVRRRVESTLDEIQMSDRRSSPIGEISGGQLQRALLGRAIISRPDVLMLDEPLSYLDRHFIDETYGLLGGIAKDTTIVLVSHELSGISKMANRHLIVDRFVKPCHSHSHVIPPPCEV
ncbi:MAG: metal ABC transporter ATP-binding protein [Muribaculaceae bacterium]|nr:metal ABC transporter ATP-binding protein [Muribaculaceae bacterium]